MSVRVALALVVGAAQVGAQAPASRCDSLIAAAVVDKVEAGLFLSARRMDEHDLSERQANSLFLNIGAVFTPPRPFQLTTFSGPPRMGTLRVVAGGEPRASLRPPTLTGVYRVVSTRTDTSVRVRTLRQSLMPGFDSAAIAAIRSAASIRELFAPPPGDEAMTIDVRFSTDSTRGSGRLVSASFPRMMVVDAVPDRSNVRPTFPATPGLETAGGEAVLRFVVGPDGLVETGTVELVRGASVEFLRAAVEALDNYRFTPARIAGCAVAQQIDFPFAFVNPNLPPNH